MGLFSVRKMNGDIGLPEFESLSWLNPLKPVANVGDYELYGATTEEFAHGFSVKGHRSSTMICAVQAPVADVRRTRSG
jgi:hypothetical protein